MTTPTRQEIIDANNALAALVCVALSNTADPDEKDWIRTIARELTAALPPMPRPTMADVNWVHSKHFLAEAEHPTYGNTVLIQDTGDGLIQCIVNYEGNTFLFRAYSHNLTPTGKRYTLTETTND